MTQSITPLVSVITATRNRLDLLERALMSIKAQDFCDFEAIVIDDGSEATVLEGYAALFGRLDDRFVLERPVAPGAPGTGPAAARNRGIRQARGEFVAFLDDDDCWLLPDHLSVGLGALQKTRGDYYFANMQGERDGRVLCPDWYPNCHELTAGPRVSEKPTVYAVDHAQLVKVIRHYLIHPNNSIIRRSLVDHIGGFVNRLSFSEDGNLMLRVADVARTILYRPEIAVSYRFPQGNSVSLSYSRIEAYLQTVFSSQHARCHCSNPAVRRVARAREAGALRELADAVERNGLFSEAQAYRRQALSTYPTLGGVWRLGSGCARALAARFRPAARPAGPRLSGSLAARS
jgi:glycosyltransferase involved in cell wall biosynthesis